MTTNTVDSVNFAMSTIEDNSGTTENPSDSHASKPSLQSKIEKI
jgi:hypothetical protein